MGKITEGTWKVEDDVVFTTKPMFGNLICVQPDPEIYAESYENWEANAKLIAAAPDMLEALTKMCEYHEKNCSWDKGDNGYYQAKQAIKKATE